MPFYSYKALNSQGDIIRGSVEQNTLELAYDKIAASGLHVVKLQKSFKLSVTYLNKLNLQSIKTAEIIEFAKNLSVMQKAGVQLITAVSDIAASTENKHFRQKLLEIEKEIDLGIGFSEALSHHKDIFPEIFISLTAVGEETGRISESLSDIALHLQRMEDLKSAIARAVMYPVFALIGTAGALFFWLVYVLPKMSSLFLSLSIELPPITRALIFASDFARSRWYVFFLVPVFLYVAYIVLSRREATKYYIDAAKLRLPIFNLIISNKLLALFAEQFRILFAAGVTIDRSLDIMINVMNNNVFRTALTDIKEDIMHGSTISESIKNHHPLFPTIVVRMISIGETTGNLTEQLNYLSEYFLNKLDDISQKMGKMIEPIIITVIGGMFLVIILGLLSPIYNLISGIR